MAAYFHEGARRTRIVAFIKSNPNCTTPTIAAAFGIEVKDAGSDLRHLRKQGRVVSAGKEQRLTWTADDSGEDRDIELRCCAVLKEWAPVQIPPQGIFAALGL